MFNFYWGFRNYCKSSSWFDQTRTLFANSGIVLSTLTDNFCTFIHSNSHSAHNCDSTAVTVTHRNCNLITRLCFSEIKSEIQWEDLSDMNDVNALYISFYFFKLYLKRALVCIIMKAIALSLGEPAVCQFRKARLDSWYKAITWVSNTSHALSRKIMLYNWSVCADFVQGCNSATFLEGIMKDLACSNSMLCRVACNNSYIHTKESWYI